jgi:hypothetical protein
MNPKKATSSGRVDGAHFSLLFLLSASVFFYSSDPEVGPALQKFMAKVQGGGGGMPGGFGGAPGGFGGGPGGFGGGAEDDGGEIPDLDDLPDLE